MIAHRLYNIYYYYNKYKILNYIQTILCNRKCPAYRRWWRHLRRHVCPAHERVSGRRIISTPENNNSSVYSMCHLSDTERFVPGSHNDNTGLAFPFLIDLQDDLPEQTTVVF